MKFFSTWLAGFPEVMALYKPYDWLIDSIGIVLLAGILSLVAGRMLKFIIRKLDRKQSGWDNTIIKSFVPPLRMAIWIMAAHYVLGIWYAESKFHLFKDLRGWRDIALILTMGWGLLRLIHRGETQYIADRKRRKKKVDAMTVSAITKILNITVFFTIGLTLLQTFGVSISGILAFGGLGGIAVGFAAKDTLENFFGAMMIYFDKPFKVGDWIRSPDQEIEGDVEHIGWRMTTIRTFDKRPLYVPNSVFSRISVENPDRMTHRRIRTHMGLRYRDLEKIPAICEAIRAMIIAHPFIDTQEVIIVNLDQFSASSCDILLSCFCTKTSAREFPAIKAEILLRAAQIVEQQGAAFAFPTQTQHIDVDAKDEMDAEPEPAVASVHLV